MNIDIYKSYLNYTIINNLKKNKKYYAYKETLCEYTYLHTTNRPFERSDIKSNISQIQFYGKFDFPLNKDDIPNTIKSIGFSKSYSHSIEGILPDSIEKITFGNNYTNHIPNSVTYIKFQSKPIGSIIIPIHIKTIVFSYDINSEDDIIYIPNNVTDVRFNCKFNIILNNGLLPNTIIHLTIMNYTPDRILPNTIPDNIKFITFGHTTDNLQLNDDNLPKKLILLLLTNNNRNKTNIEGITHSIVGKINSFMIRYIKNYEGELDRTRLIIDYDVFVKTHLHNKILQELMYKVLSPSNINKLIN